MSSNPTPAGAPPKASPDTDQKVFNTTWEKYARQPGIDYSAKPPPALPDKPLTPLEDFRASAFLLAVSVPMALVGVAALGNPQFVAFGVVVAGGCGIAATCAVGSLCRQAVGAVRSRRKSKTSGPESVSIEQSASLDQGKSRNHSVGRSNLPLRGAAARTSAVAADSVPEAATTQAPTGVPPSQSPPPSVSASATIER